MSSAGRKNSKPPSASESFASFKAAKKTYCSIDYQIECLNELYNQLMPQNGNRRAGSSSRTQDGSQNSKVLQQLRELKVNLRKDYGNPRDIPPLERLKVVVMFDDEKKAFFDIRLRPFSGYPNGYPFFIDDNDKGTIVGISEAIFQEVLKAVQEEEEEGRGGNGEGNNSSLNHNNNISHAAEEGLIRVNIKQEVEDDVKVVEVITLEENYNSQVIPPSTDNNAMSADFRGSASSAAAAAASVAAIPSENGPAVNPQANIDTNSSSSSNNNAVQQQQRQQSVNGGSTVSQGQSERQSDTVPIKLEPTDSFTVTVTRVGRSPNRAPRMAHDEAPAPAASSVAVPPVPPANVRVLQVNLRPPNVFPSKSKPQQQQLPPSHSNNNGTTPFGRQLQQQPPATAAAAAAAVAEERGTLKKMKPTEANSSSSSSNTYRILDSNNNNKRPADHSNAAQPQGSPKRAKVSASSSSSAAAAAGTSSTRAAANANDSACPLCEESYPKTMMKDHLDMAHINPNQYVPYRCTYPGCTYTNVWGGSARAHAWKEHKADFIVKAVEVVVVPTARTPGSSLVSSSAAATNRATTTTTAATTSTPSATTTTTTTASTTTTSTPFATSISQQQQQQHQRPSTTSASTSTSTAQTLSVEEYLRAHCPDYVAAKTAHTWVKCPDLKCSKSLPKYQLKDHYLSNHRGLKPYQCQWPGCGFASSWQASAAQHVKGQHNGSYAQYIVYREE